MRKLLPLALYALLTAGFACLDLEVLDNERRDRSSVDDRRQINARLGVIEAAVKESRR